MIRRLWRHYYRGTNGIIFVVDSADPARIELAAEELFKLDAAGQEPILLFINTRSGYAPAAMVVVDAIRSLKSKVHAVIQPEAFGVGAIVAVHCEKRFAFPSATVVFGKVGYDSEKLMKDEPPICVLSW
jgi:ATP-dependent protease ClpP protease subunit